jgi:pilus assembly protein Flp/PilA
MRRLFSEDGGATMIEYGLMLALIAIVCVGAVTALGTGANNGLQHGQLLGTL